MFELNKVFTVSEFNKFFKDVINELGFFSVSGEITELTITQKKGIYITISDGKSNLRLSGYGPTVKGISLVEKGMKVIAKGYCDIYVPYGSFSLCLSSIEPDGAGSLAIAYEKMKVELEEKGYFDLERKKELPQFVTKIALLTGKDSAAFSDFIKILAEHGSGIEVDFYPVIVQGENSVPSILDAINTVEYGDYDAIVLTRGGGSLEDLKSFNDIEIADAIFKSRIPFIVGVGHERDESIAEFVADLRASTPSQCAYYILEQNQRFIETIKESTEYMFEELSFFIQNVQGGLNDAAIRINGKLEDQISALKTELEFSARILKSYDVEATLERGFAVICRGEKQIKSLSELNIDEEVDITFRDGKAKVQVKGKQNS